MKKFYIEVTETLQRIVAVEAEDLEEAYERVEEWANEGEGLDYEDFVNRDFEDRTSFCETRDYSIQGDFFTLPRIPEPFEMLQILDRKLFNMYQDCPNMSYDEAMTSIRFFPECKEISDGKYKLQLIKESKYPNGWTGPLLILRRKGVAAILGYIAVGKDNKIHVVQNMTEVNK